MTITGFPQHLLGQPGSGQFGDHTYCEFDLQLRSQFPCSTFPQKALWQEREREARVSRSFAFEAGPTLNCGHSVHFLYTGLHISWCCILYHGS